MSWAANMKIADTASNDGLIKDMTSSITRYAGTPPNGAAIHHGGYPILVVEHCEAVAASMKATRRWPDEQGRRSQALRSRMMVPDRL